MNLKDSFFFKEERDGEIGEVGDVKGEGGETSDLLRLLFPVHFSSGTALL